jgi:hypothetical protein
MNTIKLLSFAFIIFLGGCMFVYGGYDDSPGGQGLGLLMAIGGAWAIWRLLRQNRP